MPKTTKSGKPKKSELPSTLQNSGKKAQRTFAKAHDAALKSVRRRAACPPGRILGPEAHPREDR